MTNEEAVKIVEDMRNNAINLILEKAQIDALDVAIKALQKDVTDTNVGELISRQEAIDAVDEQIKYCDKALASFDISLKDEYAIKVERASLNAFRETLKYLPSAEPPSTAPSTDCIIRQAAIDALKGLTANGTNKSMVFGEDAVHRIEMLPSAEPKTGRWVYHDDDDMQYDTYHCSSCKKIFTVDAEHFDDIGFVKEDLKYCPNCGSCNGGGA